MKKNITRFTALSLSLVMLLGLTACGGEKEPSADVETPPAVETPANNDDLPPRWNIDTEGGGTETPEPTPEPTPDPRILGYDFPNRGKRDAGTVNAPKDYVVTLHGGAEISLQDDVETQCIKLDGFGKIVEAPSSIYVKESGGSGAVMEVPCSASLSWADMEASVRKLLELRDDVTFEIEGMIPTEGEPMLSNICPPQTVSSVMRAFDEYSHDLRFYDANGNINLDLYNPTENDLPLNQCPVARVGLTDKEGELEMHAADVYELLGEPACVTVSWDSTSKQIKNVYYYWAGDGFYFRYGYNKYVLDDLGALEFFVDSPIVIGSSNWLMAPETAAVLRGE